MATGFGRHASGDRRGGRDDFDPVAEGDRYRLGVEVSREIWERVRDEATDRSGQRHDEQARRRFHQVAARAAARGGLLRPDPGKGLDGARWGDDLFVDIAPGKQTRIEVEDWQALEDAATGLPYQREVEALLDAASAEARDAGDPWLIPAAGFGFDEAEAVAAPLRRRRGALAGQQTRTLPATLLDTARRAQGASAGDDAHFQRLLAGLRDAIARGFRGGLGEARPDPLAGAQARNDQRPALERVDPSIALGALAVHGLTDAVRRTLTTPPARLAARVVDGAGPVPLDDRPDTLSAIAAAGAESGEPLPAELLAQLERELGRPLGHVRVHTGSASSAAARAINARAFTLGSHIYFADGELAPGTERGDRLLRHELTHVIQHDDGRLRSKSGGLEVEDHDGPAETEARAAERAAPTPAAPRGAAPTRAPSQGAGAIGRNIIDDARGVVSDIGSAGAGVVSDIASWTGDQLINAVEQVSPALANLIRNGPDGAVLDEVKKAVGGLLGRMLPGNPLAALGTIAGGISDLGGLLVGAATGDAKCCETFAGWCKSIGSFARKASTSQFVKNVKSAFAAVDTAVGSVVRFFGGVFVDAFRGQMQFLDALGGWIGDALRDLARLTQRGLDWALGKLGLPSVASIGTWLEGLAEKAWKSIKEGVAKGVEVLKEIGPTILAFSGVGPMIESFKFSMELIEVTDWLIAHRNDPDLVKHAREQMAHTFLPKLIDKTAALREKLSAAYTWVKETLGKVRDVLAKAAPYLIGLLLPLAPVLIPIGMFIRELWPKIVPVLESLWKDIKALAVKIYEYAKPVLDVFVAINLLIAQPWRLPLVIAGGAWLLLPECFKPPILELILDLMIATLEILPDSNVVFGPMWRVMKTATISFLKRVQTNWPPDQKVTVINRMARLASGASVEMMAGFVVGFFKGVVAGVLDPFKMIYELLKIAWDLSVFFAKLVNHAPQLAKVIEKHLPAMQAKAEEIATKGKQVLDDFLAGRIGFEAVWALVTSFMDQVDAAAASLGVTVADKLQAFFAGSGTEYNIAEALGIAIGFIIVFALILYFSGGTFAEAKGVIGVVAQIARILNMPYELMGAALKPLARLFAPVIDALAAVGARLGLKGAFDGAIKAFEGFVQVLGRLVEDILLAIEGRFVERTIQELIEILGRRIGTALAEKLVTELGVKGAEAVVERLGEKAVARLHTLSADALLQLSVKLDEALVTRMLDGGWTPAVIERLGLALERPVLEGLVASGLTASQLERLALLSAEKLSGQTAASLSRLAALPEGQFTRLNALGDAGFRRMLALPEGQLNRFLAVGDEQLRVFSELGDDALRRFAALTDQQFARFGPMAAGDLQRFAGLSEGAFNRFATATDEVFLKFRSMAPEALERFGALPQAAFDRFAALDAAMLDKFAGLSETAFNRFAAVGDDVFLKFQGMTPEALEGFGALSEEAFGHFAALEGPTLAKFATLEPKALKAFGELARADAGAFAKYAALSEPEIASFGRLGENELLSLGQLEIPELRKLSQLTEEGLKRLSALDEPALRRLAAMELPTLQKLETLTQPAFDKFVELSRLDPAAFQKFAALDAPGLEVFGALDIPALQKFATLEPRALEKFAGLDAEALKRFAALEQPALAKFGSLRNPEALAKFGACEPEGLAKLAQLDRAVLEKFGGWEPKVVRNISGLEMADIEIIAKLKVAPGQAVENALGGFSAEHFRMGSEVFALDRKAMTHILERHHPQYWDGSVKVEQTFLDPKMTVSDVSDAVRAVMEQNRAELIARGTNSEEFIRLTGTYNGRTYALGVAKGGRVTMFYPM